MPLIDMMVLEHTMLLLIDNYDSFTYNLYQYLSELGVEVEVFRNDKISVEDFIRIRDKRKPLKTYGTVPEQYDNFDILAALGKKVEDKGIVGVNVNIPQGKRTTSRFDINAYNIYNR